MLHTYAASCLEHVQTLLSLRDLTLKKEMIIDTELGGTFYMPAHLIGIDEQDKMIKVSIIDENVDTDDYSNWTITLNILGDYEKTTAELPINIAELHGVPHNVYEKTFYSPKEGDYVGILKPAENEARWKMIKMNGLSANKDTKAMIEPKFSNGKFIKTYDEDHSIIRFNISPEIIDGFEMDLVVPNEYITNLATMNRGNLNSKLDHLLSLDLTFKKNEIVRFRENGVMGSGVVKNKLFNTYYVKNYKNNKIVKVKKDKLFKVNTGLNHPVTSANGNTVSELQFNPHYSIETIKALDAVAKLSSTEDFLELSKIEKVKVLVNFTIALIEYDMKLAESFHFASSFVVEEGKKFGPEVNFRGINFDHCLIAGSGVCRHLSPFLGMALRETGFKDVKIGVSESISFENPGHAWIEMQIDNVSYIVEPSFQDHTRKFLEGKEINNSEPTFFMSLESVRRRSDEFDRRHYLNPRNEFIHL